MKYAFAVFGQEPRTVWAQDWGEYDTPVTRCRGTVEVVMAKNFAAAAKKARSLGLRGTLHICSSKNERIEEKGTIRFLTPDDRTLRNNKKGDLVYWHESQIIMPM